MSSRGQSAVDQDALMRGGLDDLSFSRYTAYFQVIEPLRLPPFTGSTVHGVLERAAFLVRHGSLPACDHCPVRTDCRYTYLLGDYLFRPFSQHPFLKDRFPNLSPMYQDEKTPPKPFFCEAPPGGQYDRGEVLKLSFTLVGEAIPYLPFLGCTLAAMSSLHIGQGSGQVRLINIVDGILDVDGKEVLLYDGSNRLEVGRAKVLSFPLIRQWAQGQIREGKKLRADLEFLTPFKYRYDNKLNEPLTKTIFFRNLFRRLTFLTTLYSPLKQPPDWRALLDLTEQLQWSVEPGSGWHEAKRFSSTTGSKERISGWSGRVSVSGPLAPLLPYFKLGELLHVGKMTSFGLGQYELTIP